MPKLYATSEAAQLLDVSDQTIYDWIKDGRLVPYTKTRLGYLFLPEQIEKIRKERAGR